MNSSSCVGKNVFFLHKRSPFLSCKKDTFCMYKNCLLDQAGHGFLAREVLHVQAQHRLLALSYIVSVWNIIVQAELMCLVQEGRARVVEDVLLSRILCSCLDKDKVLFNDANLKHKLILQQTWP